MNGANWHSNSTGKGNSCFKVPDGIVVELLDQALLMIESNPARSLELQLVSVLFVHDQKLVLGNRRFFRDCIWVIRLDHFNCAGIFTFLIATY